MRIVCARNASHRTYFGSEVSLPPAAHPLRLAQCTVVAEELLTLAGFDAALLAGARPVASIGRNRQCGEES